MANLPPTPYETLYDAIQYFSEPRVCVAFLAKMRWGDDVACPRCGSCTVTALKTRQLWQCKDCKKQFSVKLGTIFEDSAISLSKWLIAMWMVANDKNGVSSYEIHRAIGVGQKAAHFMGHRIRKAMDKGSVELSDHIEIDETYLNPSRNTRKKYHRNHKTAKERAIFGMVQRGGEAFARRVPDAKSKTLEPIIRNNVNPVGATIYSDNYSAYDHLNRYVTHLTVNHNRQWVDGAAHTNNIECFWNLFKRCLKGTYIQVEDKHLNRYLDEEVFRYDHRKLNDRERFLIAVSSIFGKRLTYEDMKRGAL